MRHEKITMSCGENISIGLQVFHLAAAIGIGTGIAVLMSLPQAVYFDPAWVLLFAVVCLLSYPRSQRSIYTRMMWISSSRADEIEDAIREAVGREVTRIPASMKEESKQRMKLVIYRLEERMLKDLVRSIDPAAEYRIMPFYEWKGEGRQDLR